MAAQTNNLLRKEARERAGIVRDPEYTIDLDLTTGDETFGCVTTVNFRADAGAATFIDYTAPEVTAATLNGRQLPKDAFNGDRIALEGLEAENELVVEGASAYVNTGAGLHRFADPVDNEVYLHSQFEPFDAHRVYPCFDQPDIKGTFEFTVKAPQGWRVVGNTLQIAGDPSGEALLWRFPVTKKMSTYITAIVAGPFEILRDNHNGIDLGLLCRKSMLKYLMPDSEELFEITKQSFDFFEKLFDYPYVFGKYDQLFVPEFNAGAMENAGCVTFNEAFVFRSRVTQAVRERRASVITHEMSHMWFGDLVTMRWWDDLWLNESFASYQQTLALAEATRFTDAWTRFAQGTKAFAYMQDQLPTTHPITADIPDTEATHSNFDGITYSKGASVLKQLVAWVGRDAFDEGLRRYFKRYEYGNTELSDFLSCLEETSGRDLAQWSKQWLETAGVNTFSASFEEEDGAFTSFDLIQDAHPDWPTLRSHRIAIGLYEDRDGKLAAADRIEMDASGKRTEVKDLIGKKMPDLIVINDADLTYAKVRLDDRSLATLVNRLKDIDDSLARALCWAATWEMVRDAEMAARDYLKMVTNNIGTETDIGVVQTLLGQTFAAITTYGDPDNRSVALQTLAAWALDGMKTADPGSDLQ
ncbi:MAG: aminopeptidase N, partial [Actinomycetota bacterium]